MISSWLEKIPKVIIGNPETALIAYDVIPNYIPTLVKGVTLNEGGAYFRGKKLILEEDEARLIALCNGSRSFADILDCAEVILERRGSQAMSPCIFSVLKQLRSLGLVERDNRFTGQGLFIRLRELHEGEKRNVRWIYLPPFAQRVFELCSGSFSVHQIGRKIQEEFGVEKLRHLAKDEAVLLNVVAETCRRLEREQVIAWIDDEASRTQRLRNRTAA